MADCLERSLVEVPPGVPGRVGCAEQLAWGDVSVLRDGGVVQAVEEFLPGGGSDADASWASEALLRACDGACALVQRCDDGGGQGDAPQVVAHVDVSRCVLFSPSERRGCAVAGIAGALVTDAVCALRPAGYSAAVVVADLLVASADPDTPEGDVVGVLERFSLVDDAAFYALLSRALLQRIGVYALSVAGGAEPSAAVEDAFVRAVEDLSLMVDGLDAS